jgi:hypothetical protein
MSDDKPPVIPFHPDQLLPDVLLAALMSTSVDTLQRLRAKGEGPPRTRISERRYGTRVRDYQEWLDSKQGAQATR